MGRERETAGPPQNVLPLVRDTGAERIPEGESTERLCIELESDLQPNGSSSVASHTDRLTSATSSLKSRGRTLRI